MLMGRLMIVLIIDFCCALEMFVCWYDVSREFSGVLEI